MYQAKYFLCEVDIPTFASEENQDLQKVNNFPKSRSQLVAKLELKPGLSDPDYLNHYVAGLQIKC